MTAQLDTSRGVPYCAGCGHPHVLHALDEALAATGVPPGRVALVTDIGCVGLADRLFPGLHTVHTLHGRSVAIAAGLVLSGRAPEGEPPRPIVLIGDGGAGIGLLHLVHAAQLDVDLTVLVHNNLVYGMTGGQHSMLTPDGLKTATTPEGCPVPPLDLGAVLTGAGAGYFARVRAPSRQLAPAIADAIRHPGFACVEALELCPAHATRTGGVTGKALDALPGRLGLPLGVRRAGATRPGWRAPAPAEPETGVEDVPVLEPHPEWRRLDRTARVVVAGRAGGRVQSAAQLAATAAVCAGLEVALRTDNPVTQGKGFSLAELAFGPGAIEGTGSGAPDLALVVANEGRRELEARGPIRAARVVFDATLEAPDGAVLRALGNDYGPQRAALGGLIEETLRAGWWHPDAWRAAIQRLTGPRRAEAEAVIRKCAAARPAARIEE